ncbi:inactive ubiquitin carboxyl-terminal hydrolase 54, partial [Lates japonicus]
MLEQGAGKHGTVSRERRAATGALDGAGGGWMRPRLALSLVKSHGRTRDRTETGGDSTRGKVKEKKSTEGVSTWEQQCCLINIYLTESAKGRLGHALIGRRLVCCPAPSPPRRGNGGVQVVMSWKRNYFASGGGAVGGVQGLVTPRTMTSIAPSKGLSNEPGQNSCFLNSALQ